MAKPQSKAKVAPKSRIIVKFVAAGTPVRPPPLPEDQKHFPQHGMALENWGVGLFGCNRHPKPAWRTAVVA